MAKTRDFLQRKAMERVPTPVLDAAGRAVLKGVDQAVDRRWQKALDRAEEAEGDTVDERIAAVSRSFRREMVSLGAATGATAAAPGIGTASAVSVVVVEMTWFAFRSTDLIMTIGAVHGRVDASVEERRAWVLSVLAFGEQAADEFADLISGVDPLALANSDQVGTLVAGVVGSDVATVDTLRRLNTTLATNVVSKYGSRRGVLMVGKLLPFGIGAVVGGSTNWALTRGITKQANRFFADYRLAIARVPAIGAGDEPPALPTP